VQLKSKGLLVEKVEAKMCLPVGRQVAVNRCKTCLLRKKLLR